MAEPSPALRAFLRDAVAEKIERDRRGGLYPDEFLLREVRELVTYLVLAPPGSPSPLESSSGAAGGLDAQSGRDGHASGAAPLALSREEVARELRVSITTVDRLRASGALRATTAGRRVLFSRDAVEEYARREAS